jgi:hypothetical protein
MHSFISQDYEYTTDYYTIEPSDEWASAPKLIPCLLSRSTFSRVLV